LPSPNCSANLRILFSTTKRSTFLKSGEIKVFTQSDELDAYLQKKPKNFILLADNDVGRGYKTGLSYIFDNNLQKNSYLVTNSYDDVNIVKKAMTNNLKIIPKLLFISNKV